MVIPETLQQVFQQALATGEFPNNLESADAMPVFKNNNPLNKETDPSLFYLLFQKYLKT